MNLRSYEEVASAVRNGVEFVVAILSLPPSARIHVKWRRWRSMPRISFSAIIGGRSTREIAEQFKADIAFRIGCCSNTVSCAGLAPTTGLDPGSSDDAGSAELYRG